MSHPNLVGLLHRELAIEHVVSHCQGVFAVGGMRKFASPLGMQTMGLHQATATVAPNDQALRTRAAYQAPAAVGIAAGSKGC